MKIAAIGALLWLLGVNSAHAQKSEAEMLRDARNLYASGKLSQAENTFSEITHEHPDDIAAQMYLGQTLFKEGKFAAAVVPYEKVQLLERSGTKLTLTQHRILGDQLAMAYGISGRSADAKALLQESIQTDPRYSLNYYNLACVSADEDDRAEVWKNLLLAFQHKDEALPGEKLPDPASDPSFKKYTQDADFKNLLDRLKQL
jgi:Flp pilus assembly protein TadD